MVLIDNVGTVLEIATRDWNSACSEAVRHGWAPEGTVPAPDPLSPEAGRPRVHPSNAAYHPAVGQLVTRRDAAALAAALDRALAAEPRLKTLESLARFCRRSGFLVCEPTGSSVRSGLLRLAEAIDERKTCDRYSETLKVTPD